MPTQTTPTFKVKYKNAYGYTSVIETDFRILLLQYLKVVKDLGFKVISIKFKPQKGRIYFK